MSCEIDSNSFTGFDAWAADKNASLDNPPEDISSLRQNIFSMAECLSEKIRSLKNLSTSQAMTQLQIAKVNQDIENEKKNIITAEERLSFVKRPAETTSFYASWFPMERPLKPISKPILIAISVFLTLASLRYSISHINAALVGLYAYVMTNFPAVGAFVSQLSMPFWVILITFIAVVIYFTNTKKQ
jgi:hypothetical protein